jgi:muramoyltetrapeptide carboxypeptidase
MKALKPGSIIEIIAPAGKINVPAELPIVENLIKSWGFTPRFGKHLLSDHAFLSNSTELRFDDLQQALYTPDSEVLWCYRGGSGCAELLPLLAKLAPPAKQKIILGLSDITALLIFLHEHWQWQTFHAPCARQFSNDNLSADSKRLVKSLFLGELHEITIDDLTPLNSLANKPFALNAEIIGGNLAVISHLLGTPYQPHPVSKILLLEDINEPAYKIRRMLTHLTQTGIFNEVKAIIFGEFITDNENEKLLISIELHEFAKIQSVPVLQTKLVGHGNKNYLLPFGKSAELLNHKMTITLPTN